MAPSVSILTGSDCISNIENTVEAMTFLNPFLNQATQKNTRQIILPQKNPGIENFKPKKILRSSLSLEPQSTPLGMNVE